jgi:lipopolysaccharide export system protein LptA
MTAKKICLFVFFILFALQTCAWAQAGFNQKGMVRKSEPIHVVSDKMEAFQEKKMVVFSGSAVATQGDIQLKTDRLSVYYKKSNDKKEKIGKQEVEAAGDLEKIVAQGNVIVTQKEMSATGDEAVYYQESAQIVMTGKPVLRQGKNVIKGCRVIFYINENRGKVEQCETENSERVTAVIQPQDKK